MTREAFVRLVDQAISERLQIEVLILERMVVLVRVIDLLDRADIAAFRQDVQLLVDGVVETEDLTLEQVDVDVLELRLLREQPEPVVQPLVRGDLVGGIVLLEGRPDDLRHLVGRHDVRLDRRLLLEPPHSLDLIVDRRVDGREVA